MRGVTLVVLLGLATPLAFAEGMQEGPEKVATAAETADDEAKEESEFKVPAGFRARKLGERTVYCRKDVTSGSRFSSEKCYTETQLAEAERQKEEARREVGKSRAICSADGACGAT